MQSFDFSCSEPVKVLDINAGGSGNVTSNFQNYSQQVNLDLIRNVFKNTPILSTAPDDVMEKLSRYPETNSCIEEKK